MKKSDPRHLDVLHAPGVGDPYLTELARGFAARGVLVRVDDRLPTWGQIARRPPDILHLHWLHVLYGDGGRRPAVLARAFAFLMKLTALRLRGTRVVWTTHNLMPHDTPWTWLARMVRRGVTRVASAGVGHSQRSLSQVQARFGRFPKTAIIPLVDYTSAMPAASEPKMAREALGLPSDAFVFLSFGLVRPYKGLDELVRVFRKIPGEHLRLLIVGKAMNAEFEGELRRLASHDSRVILRLKRVAESEVPNVFAAANFAVAPYRKVLTSGSVALALSLETPVVAPARGELPRLVGKDAGILYDPRKRDGLKDALLKAINSDISRMKTATHRAKKRGVSTERAVATLLELYSEIAPSPRKR